MRYYKHPRLVTNQQALETLYADLDKKEKRQYRKATILSKMGTGVFWVALMVGMAVIAWLISLMKPSGEGIFWSVLNVVIQVVFGLAGFIVMVILALLVATPLWNSQSGKQKAAKRILLFKATEYLRKAYKLNEPCLVTKCYECDEEPSFNNHDVCIFVVNGELRITANLLHGFFNPDSDLGCFILSREEIALTLCPYGDITAAKLTCDGVTFLLGQKAYGFIRRYLLQIHGEQPLPRTHLMKLHPSPFDAIRDGRKTVELRLNDGKRQKIRVGDDIVFTQTQTGEQITATVVALRPYRDFEAMYAAEDPIAMGYAEGEVAHPTDMSQYYTDEQIQRYGTLAIEIRKETNL